MSRAIALSVAVVIIGTVAMLVAASHPCTVVGRGDNGRGDISGMLGLRRLLHHPEHGHRQAHPHLHRAPSDRLLRRHQDAQGLDGTDGKPSWEATPYVGASAHDYDFASAMVA
ncbi:hypothetical protein ABIA31_008048 [Catenulispora sp. MAP5-51]|uniref:hypothetical protein n=1 Tax=Catenulispora sp. MAP5-51 TaxID=3156298 RepID=UPI003515710E